jgi:hypothetical protein
MVDEQHDTDTGNDKMQVALTPRPIRLMLFGNVAPGQEGAVREAQARFPVDAAAAAGIAAVEAYIGSGQYAIAFEIDVEDTQEALSTCLNDRRIREFIASLHPAVAGLPGPGWSFGASDTFHEDAPDAGAPVAPGPVYTSADLPLAANMYRWRAGAAPETGNEPHGHGWATRNIPTSH